MRSIFIQIFVVFDLVRVFFVGRNRIFIVVVRYFGGVSHRTLSAQQGAARVKRRYNKRGPDRDARICPAWAQSATAFQTGRFIRISRTVRVAEFITRVWVSTWPPPTVTPSRSAPLVTPVAEKMASPFTRSSR